MGGEFGMDLGAELRVDGGQHLVELFHLGDRQPAGGQGVGHFQADVATTDDHRAGRGCLFEGAHDGEGVTHRMQQVHPIPGAEGIRAIQPTDRGPHRHRAGADDQLVVGKQLLLAIGGRDQQLAASHVDPAGGGVQPQHHPGRLQVGDRAVRQVAPVGHLTGDVVGDAADREVRETISGHHGDIRARVEFTGPQGRADARVAATNRHQMHAGSRSG